MTSKSMGKAISGYRILGTSQKSHLKFFEKYGNGGKRTNSQIYWSTCFAAYWKYFGLLALVLLKFIPSFLDFLGIVQYYLYSIYKPFRSITVHRLIYFGAFSSTKVHNENTPRLLQLHMTLSRGFRSQQFIFSAFI